MPDTLTAPVPGLVVADRCDRCPAQALVRLVHPTAGILDFCRHDYRKRELALVQQGFEIAHCVSELS